jgi:Restriction endonuclease
MSACQRRYWAIRTDKENKSLLLGELCAGRLRQGWGYDPSQNLRLVQDEIARGGAWWDRLTEKQKEVLLHLKMLSAAHGGVKIGDWILVPNLPDYGAFVIAEVTGDYQFEPLDLVGDTDVNGLATDYAHVLPVRLITDRGINRYAEHVDARIRSTLRTPMRMWNVDGYRDEIERLVNQYKSGGDFATAVSGEARLRTAWDLAIFHATAELQQRLGLELDSRFQAAEWEEPITQILGNLYPGADVRWVGGPKEAGADVIVQLANHFGGVPWLIVVQIKNYTGEIGPAVLQQLRVAHERYSTEGTILSLVVMTTAERTSADLRDKSDLLVKEFGVPIRFLLRKDVMQLLCRGLMAKGADNRDAIQYSS